MTIRRCFLWLQLVLVLGMTSTAAAGEFQAGTAKRVITPNPLLPVSGGLGPTAPAREKRGELWARAIVLQRDETTVAIVSLDLLGFPSVLGDRVRARIPRIPGKNVLIGATHTHSAPDCYAFPDGRGGHTGNLEYMDFVCVKAAEAVNEALDRLQPARLKIATDEARGKIAYNYYAPDLYDRRMSVVQALDTSGQTLATLVNYAIHPEVLGPGLGILSPDLVGPLCDRLEERAGGMALFMNGAQGGMITADNRDLDRPKDSQRGYWHDLRTWDECLRIGHTMADEALRIIADAPVQSSPGLFCGSLDVTFPVDNDVLWNVILGSPLKYPRNPDRSVTSRINVVNIGNAQILTIPGEALPNIGFYLKRHLHGDHQLLFGLTNDAFGYIMTKVDFRSFPRYEYISRTSLGERTGEILIERALELVDRCPPPDRLPLRAAAPSAKPSPAPAAVPAPPILIDGRFDDWAGVRSYTDPQGDTHDTDHKEPRDTPSLVDHPDVDLLEYKVTHDDENFYFYFRSRGRIARTQKADAGKPAGRYYVIVAIDVDDNDDTGYWLHEGGYYPTSRGYDVNAEIEFFDGEFNTACYLNHGATNLGELQQAFRDQSSGQFRNGHDGPYPAGFLRLLPGTYRHYTQWVYHADNTLTFVRDKGPVVRGLARAAVSPDGHQLEASFPFKGFLKDEHGRPIVATGRTIDLSFSLEASGELAHGQWASDTAEPIRGYVLSPRASATTATPTDAPRHEAELIFPLHPQHNHAPGIVECPNGDLLASWYRGSGERNADDVAVFGSRRLAGAKTWSEPFVLADRPGFPDCNTCMMIDSRQRLWLFWPTILANSWESCLTNFKVSSHYAGAGSPRWDREGLILMKPDDFRDEALKVLDSRLSQSPMPLTDAAREKLTELRQRLGDKLFQRLGWQPRCKPTVLPSGRILLPLYTDTFSMSIMAVSDDGGESWFASKPLIGLGNIQPAVLRRDDGTLVAYMRENGPLDRVRVAESKDDGLTWGPVGVADLPNPGSGLDGVRLSNGHWALIYNDTTTGRHSLAVSISADEGRSWKWTRHLEKQTAGSYHYPAIIQGQDGTIHAVYSYFVEGGKSMKHAAFNEAWVLAGDSP